MASIVRIKRSTGTNAPSALNFGELAYTESVGTHGNKGGRLFVGDHNGLSGDVDVSGGKYYTDLLSIGPGLIAGQTNAATAANGFVPVVDQNRKVDQWNVDNLTLDGNTLSSTDANGDIIIAPEDTGSSPVDAGAVIIPDDTYLAFGSGKDGKIEYDENGTDKVQVSGADWVFNNAMQIAGGVSIDNVGISSNVISTLSGGGNTLYIDPYPDGLSSEGLVIVKGSLQVDGTTTTVNSTSATLNDPIMNIGDVTSKLTVMATVASGVSTVTVDSVVGINTGDLLSLTNLPNSGLTTVTAYDTTSKVITFTGTTTGGITTEAQITVTHAFDTNTDRGISFQYNTSTGSSNNKTGFFGYNDSAGENSNAPARSLTYIPDATITANVVTGTRGTLDIKNIYFQTGDFDATGNGILYFDTTGKVVGAAATSSGISTSNYVLTTDASGIPKWTTTLDGGTF